jgi:hypothetical protein
METQSIRRTAYWFGLFIFIILLAIFMTGSRLSLIFRLLVVLLLGVLSAFFRFRDLFSFMSISVSCIIGVFAGAVFASSIVQFWLIAFLFVLTYFSSSRLLEKNVLGI